MDANDPKVEKLIKLGNAKRDSLVDYLERSHRNDEKTTESENLLSALTDRFATLKNEKLEVPELYKQFTVCPFIFSTFPQMNVQFFQLVCSTEVDR